jgi:ribosomal protein S17
MVIVKVSSRIVTRSELGAAVRPVHKIRNIVHTIMIMIGSMILIKRTRRPSKMKTYRIYRSYADGEIAVIEHGLTLAEAQEHCKNIESDSSTCASKAGKTRTAMFGPWLDFFMPEK